MACSNRVELGLKIDSVTLSTMTRLLKQYLLWLLIAVLPLQGFAAVVQRSCGFGAVVLTSSSFETSAHILAIQSLNAVEVIEQAVSDHDECPEHAAALAKEPSGSHGVKHSSCSACASCCMGAAAPPGFFACSLPSNTPEVRRASVVPPVLGYISDRLDRPPRHRAV